MAGRLQNRWAVLAVLFIARVTMAFQFQAVAALAPVYEARFGVSLADIGLLIGLYLSPGLVIALPGGAIGRRIGDRPAIAAGMALMVAGAVVMVLSPSWAGQLAGRLLAGTGGVLLNVLMSKLVTDLFAGREIATAMGIFVNSWPVGIAATLLVLPLIGPPDDPQQAQIAVALVALAGLGLFLLGTRPAASVATGGESAALRGAALGAVIVAGSIWGLYNAAIGMVFGFGPAMLVERGWSLPAASATTSLALWALALSVPLGGVLADKLGRRDMVMLGSCLLFGALLSVTPGSAQTLLLIALTGLAGGLAAGPIMSLPAAVLVPGNRALGMGVFFTLFYLCIVLAPVLAGWLSEHRGTAAAAFHLGTAMLGLCCAALLPYRALARCARNA